jgi:hypothetical protein
MAFEVFDLLLLLSGIGQIPSTSKRYGFGTVAHTALWVPKFALQGGIFAGPSMPFEQYLALPPISATPDAARSPALLASPAPAQNRTD